MKKWKENLEKTVPVCTTSRPITKCNVQKQRCKYKYYAATNHASDNGFVNYRRVLVPYLHKSANPRTYQYLPGSKSAEASSLERGLKMIQFLLTCSEYYRKPYTTTGSTGTYEHLCIVSMRCTPTPRSSLF